MDKSIIQLVDELPTDNITVKVLKALDYLMPGQWDNLVGFDQSIRAITGESDPQVIQKIRDRAVALYHDPTQGYQTAITLYQTIDRADAALATAALANKVGEKISFLSFLNKMTPKADTTQSLDLLLKVVVELIAYCKLNGLPNPNPQQFAAALANNYQDAALMRMMALVCIDGLLPLGPNFLGKIHEVMTGKEGNLITGNPVFVAINNLIPGNSPSEKVGFINQGFEAVEGWMNNLVAKTGVTPQSIMQGLGKFIQVADDNLDFVAAFLDQATNYYEHTGIQTVARKLILDAHGSMNLGQLPATGKTSGYAVGQTVEVWDEEEEDWYEASILKIKKDKYLVHYVGYGASDDDWVAEEDVRDRNYSPSDDYDYAIGQKVKVWDKDEKKWCTAIIEKVKRKKCFVHYLDDDSSDDDWVNNDDIS
jgi:hypothetical protein